MAGKVLVVDDEDTLRLTIKTRLATGGFETDDAVDGEQALEKLKQGRFDVVLLDINMPRMDGITALGVITELYPKTDVIMLTGFADFSTAIECLKKGARDYLVKPIDTTELITRMRSLQRARTSEAALEEAQRTRTAFLFDEILGRAIRIHDSIESMVKGLHGKVTKDQTALLSSVMDLSGAMTAEVKKNVDPKYLKSDSPALSVKSIAVDKLVESSAARSAESAKAKGLKLEHHADKKLPKAEADAARLEEGLILATAALVELSSKGGMITVHLGQKDDALEVTFEASKVGEKGAKIAEQIGRPFDAMGSALTKLENPAALLLAARRVFNAHKGAMKAASTKGNLTIRCLLPLKQTE